MSVVSVRMNDGRPGGRVYFGRRRCHHGAAGVACVAVGLAAGGFVGGALVVGGLWLMWDDRHDFRSTLWLMDS